jgi:hypothetical protein
LLYASFPGGAGRMSTGMAGRAAQPHLAACRRLPGAERREAARADRRN